MSHFDDVLDSEDKLLSIAGEDITDPHKAYKIKIFSYKIKSAPDANTSLSIGQDMSKGKSDGQFDFKQKAELKRKEGEFDFKWVITNKDYEAEAEWAPKDLNDGIETTLGASAKYTPTKETNKWEASANVQSGGFDMGPVKPYFGLHFETNHDGEHEVKAHENLVYEKDFNVASSMTVDVNNKALKEAQGILAWKNQEFGQLWFRSNCKARFMGLGWQGKLNGNKTAAEIQFDASASEDKQLGLFKLPIWLKLGTQMKTANGCSVGMSLNSGENHIMSSKWDMPVASNLKITYADKVDLLKVFTAPADANYQSGFSAEFKI